MGYHLKPHARARTGHPENGLPRLAGGGSGRRSYSPGLGRWLSRDAIQRTWWDLDPYAFVVNTPLAMVDPDGNMSLIDPALAIKMANAMARLRDCRKKMKNAEDEARRLWDIAQDVYVCCVDGEIVPLDSFPGVVTGDPGSRHGVLHCLLGYRARKNGVDKGCLDVANFLWEVYEFVNPKYWEWLPKKKGPKGWLKDTKSDMKEVLDGYTGAKSPADCIPSQCKHKLASE